ncbi:hypothetical protein F5B20DRAFT_541245 [Whalleya microplaca]|nr:hypothetical protein F5B20DRAFT_541245 [Whalleya microplaca]
MPVKAKTHKGLFVILYFISEVIICIPSDDVFSRLTSEFGIQSLACTCQFDKGGEMVARKITCDLQEELIRKVD